MVDQKTDGQTVEQQEMEQAAAFEAGFEEQQPAQAPAAKTEESKSDGEHTESSDDGKKEAKADEEEGKKQDESSGKEPDLKAELAAISARLGTIDAMDHRLKSMEGRYAAVQNQLQELAAAKAAAAKVDNAPTKAQIDAASGSTEKWARIKEDYPEWADAMEERLAAIKVEAPKTDGLISKEEFEKSVGKIHESVYVDVRRRLNEEVVEDAHEGWKTTINTSDFKEWFGKQAPEVQALSKSPRARDAISLLDKFKAAKTKAAETDEEKRKKEAELDANTSPKGTGKRGATQISDDDAFNDGFEAA